MFKIAPAANRVEVFKRKPNWVHEIVTACAGCIGPMLGQAFADGQGGGDCFFFQSWNVAGQRRRRCAEEVAEHPVSANHGRSASSVGRDGKDAAMPEQTAAFGFG